MVSSKKSSIVLTEINDKIKQSTSTIVEARCAIFTPTQKLSGNSRLVKEFKKNGGIRKFKTSSGEIEYRGRVILTQVHKDLLDCIYATCKEITNSNSNEITIYFSQYAVLKKYSEGKTTNFAKKTPWFQKKMEEIRDGVIKYNDTKGNWTDFNLISGMSYSKEHESYFIVLGSNYLNFFKNELSIDYKQELNALLKIQQPVFKAIIRWFFTQRVSCILDLISVLREIDFQVDSAKSLQIFKRILKESHESFERFGIKYDVEREEFHYSLNQNINFVDPIENHKSSLLNYTLI